MRGLLPPCPPARPACTLPLNVQTPLAPVVPRALRARTSQPHETQEGTGIEVDVVQYLDTKVWGAGEGMGLGGAQRSLLPAWGVIPVTLVPLTPNPVPSARRPAPQHLEQWALMWRDTVLTAVGASPSDAEARNTRVIPVFVFDAAASGEAWTLGARMGASGSSLSP
jgi:hypothetical protein